MPEIVPGSQFPTVDNPPPFSPPIINNNQLGEVESSALNSKKPRAVKKILLIGTAVLLVGFVFASLFVFAPTYFTKSYILATKKDFNSIRTNLTKEKSKYSGLFTSIEITKGVYFEIGEIRSYSDSLLQARKNLEIINSAQTMVKDAQERKKKLYFSSNVRELSNALDKYYQKLGDGLGKLGSYEKFETDMLSAVGDDFNQELARIFVVYSPTTGRDALVAYFQNLSRLADASVGRLNSVGQPYQQQVEIYKLVLDAQKDISQTAKNMAGEIVRGTPEGDEAAKKLFSAYSGRIQERNIKISNATKSVVGKSDIRNSFISVVSQEEQVNSLFGPLEAKYFPGN